MLFRSHPQSASTVFVHGLLQSCTHSLAMAGHSDTILHMNYRPLCRQGQHSGGFVLQWGGNPAPPHLGRFPPGLGQPQEQYVSSCINIPVQDKTTLWASVNTHRKVLGNTLTTPRTSLACAVCRNLLQPDTSLRRFVFQHGEKQPDTCIHHRTVKPSLLPYGTGHTALSLQKVHPWKC